MTNLNALDGQVTAAMSIFDARQNQYLNNNGRHFQGLNTHTVIPTIGTPDTPIDPDPSVHPSDQSDNWTNFGGLPSSADLYTTQIDVYQVPSGSRGYMVTFTTNVSGSGVRRKTFNRGPESHRDSSSAWT